jgi:hypothetical protein
MKPRRPPTIQLWAFRMAWGKKQVSCGRGPSYSGALHERMRRVLTFVLGLAVLVAALGLIRHLLWRPAPTSALEPEPAQTQAALSGQPEPSAPVQAQSNVQIVVPEEVAAPALPFLGTTSTNYVPPPPLERIQWEQQIDDILLSEAESADKGRQLLDLFPRLPPEAQIEAAPHLANLTTDEDFVALSPWLTNATTPQAVLEVLVGDLLNRPNRVKLPLLVAIARVHDHPSAAEAKQVLETMLGEDFGDDWLKWEAAVQAWLKEHEE